MTTTVINDWKELASRERDGLVVSLFWSRTADLVTLAVADQNLDEEFHINVAGAHALDAFYHPFAYAAVAVRRRLRPDLRLSPRFGDQCGDFADATQPAPRESPQQRTEGDRRE